MGGLQDRAICFIFADMDMTIMLAVGFFGSAEFYILLAVVAAAIVAAALFLLLAGEAWGC